ncbi:FHA domain-containing protein [Leptolyngbya ohadii]|uniref:FHA domain-containing protein n=1 Tax=Leptolyngbya ohadii TaxID=1962290 RepID=UPI000B59BD25|nr:FHA domain-containing protein [Leptolyngbya ohadii]
MLKLKSVHFEQQQFQVHCLKQTYAGQLEWLIGRNQSCDLVLSSPEVSRVHGRVIHFDGAYYFVDVGSTSGSLLNGASVTANHRYLLRLGDLLQLGEVLLYVEEISPPALSGAMPSSVLQEPEEPWAGEDIVCQCRRIVQETPDVKTFSFVADPPVLFNFKPGQFVNLEVEIDGKPVVRCYSISSSPTRPYSIDLTVKRSPGLGEKTKAPRGLVSNWLHDHFKVGDRVRFLGGAMGHFTCLPKVPAKMLLISAGSGITPLMSMARWVKDTLLDTDIVFLYSTRTPRDFIFRTELAEMTAQMPNFHLAVTLTRPSPNQAWMGLTGRVSESMLNLVVPDLLERSVYVCGSEGFTENVKSILEAIHFPMSNYYSESFGGSQEPPTQPLISDFPPSPTRSAAPAAAKPQNGQRNGHHPTSSPSTASPSTATNTLSIVTFAQSDREVLANSSSSLLELAEQAGVTIRSACRVGACGACKVATRDGKVQYDNRPPALTPADEEVGYALACVARPAGALVVEA